jgi:predicted NAD/FAD-binding protein
MNLRYYADLVSFLQERGMQFQKEVFQMSFADAEYGSVLRYRQVRFFGGYWPQVPLSVMLSSPFRFAHMLFDAAFFYRRARSDLQSGVVDGMTLGEYLAHLKQNRGYTSVFLESIILPVLSLALTADFDTVRSMPADIPVRWLASGLFTMRRSDGGVYRPIGGVTQMSATLGAPLKDVRTSTSITNVTRLEDGKIQLQDSNGASEVYDHIVLATQANQALKLVGHLDPHYENLSKIKHTTTSVVIHTDSTVMGPEIDPRYSFHMLADRTQGQAMSSIWMNPTMPQLPVDVHQTTNPIVPLDPAKILFEHTFERPVIDVAAAVAIRALQQSNGSNNIWFCGSYSLYGMPLLENGAQSAFRVAEALTGKAVNLRPSLAYPSFFRRLLRYSLIGAAVAAAAVGSLFFISPSSLAKSSQGWSTATKAAVAAMPVGILARRRR